VAEHEAHEQRRERWIARREARLSELGEQAGVSADQQSAVLAIMLANRDQIADIFQEAETAEAFNEARAKVTELREQAEGQIRGLLSPEQYEVYRTRFADDERWSRAARAR